MSGTSVKITKNEVGCRDDTMPKTAETKREHATIFHNPLPTSLVFGGCGRLLTLGAHAQRGLRRGSCRVCLSLTLGAHAPEGYGSCVCVSVCLLLKNSLLQSQIASKTRSHTQRRTEVRKYVGFSLKLLCSKVMA